jgi:hypothetical protein
LNNDLTFALPLGYCPSAASVKFVPTW